MRNILLFFFTVITLNSIGQTVFSLEKFNQHTDFYTAFNVGSGTVNASTNSTEFLSGTASLQLNYFLNASDGSFFSSLKNYGTKTQDWGTTVDTIFISLKGGNNYTSFTIRLYEDINKNGQLDGTDEIFQGFFQTANTPSFQTYSFSIASMQKLTGNGNSQLDLNNIRAYDIAFKNDDVNNPNSGTIYIDELTLKTSYVAPTNGTAKLSGSFIQLWNSVGCKCGQFSLQEWKDEFQKMKDLCLEKVFIQYSVYDNLSWYTPSNVLGVQTNYNALNKIFTAAEDEGIKVYTGIYFDETWNNSNKALSSTYSSLITKQQSTIDEIWNLFGSSPAFEGLYIPQEINDLEWQGITEKNLLFNYIKDVSAYAKGKNNSKHVMIAPFFNLHQTSNDLADWYNELFIAAPNLDQVFFQDGVGITLKDPEFHLPIYYPALKTVCENNNVDFGVTAESFHQLTGWPIDGGSFSATSTEIDQFKKQLWAAEKFQASEVIQFSWSYIQEGNSIKSTELYNDYSAYANCIPTRTNKVDSQPPLVFPNPVYNSLFFDNTYEVATIIDELGRIVKQKKNCSYINVSDLEAGLYIIKLENLKNISTEKTTIGKTRFEKVKIEK